MRLTLRAGGSIKSGPERDLIDDYLSRARHLSRNLGILGIDEQQVDLRHAKTRADETKALMPDAGGDTHYVILDERGKSLTSRQIAKQMAKWRDDGERHVTFVIGGADGFEPSALPKTVTKWSFGQQTWPHKIVRVMLSEQLYRALSILAGTPYHRD